MNEHYASSEGDMNDQTVPFETTIIDFGPQRIMGMSLITANENGEVPALWGNEGGFATRMNEVQQPEAVAPCFGVCRCVPGITDGRFEYIAAVSASADAVLPDGMVELTLPKAQYLSITVPSLEHIGAAWNYLGQWFAEHPEWRGYCGPGGCECNGYPTFEYYTSDFFTTNKLYVYAPIRPTE
ncbi:MAG: GyrI-like domain-containing protein [Armatimonadota bacterium]